ncbi:hypothetical protein IW150_007308, partial [Coemansia sp. RSA 2607]
MSTSPACTRVQPTVEIPSEGRDTRSPFAVSSASAVSRTPSAVDFPGAFSTRPKAGAGAGAGEAGERMSLVPKGMKTRVTEAVGGGLANVVGGVYSLVSYVNPLSSGSNGAADAEKTDAEKADGPQSPATAVSDASSASTTSSPAMLLQAPSAGTSVAADLDEQCLADANADNPESNRPPTPTKASFTRMLRFPTPDDGGSGDRPGKTKAKGKGGDGGGDPVSRNVSQRTGQLFLPGAEERRRYMRRVEKAPRLDESSSEDDSSDNGEQQQQGASTVDGWRFVAPRTKRVKRRALWRLFLAQEITPAVYDE